MSHINPAIDKTCAIGYIANIANHPIPIYMALLNPLGHVTQNILKIIPSTAQIVTAKNKLKPTFPCRCV